MNDRDASATDLNMLACLISPETRRLPVEKMRYISTDNVLVGQMRQKLQIDAFSVFQVDEETGCVRRGRNENMRNPSTSTPSFCSDTWYTSRVDQLASTIM